MLDDCSRRGCGRPCLFFFFFQAEDGIRDHCVTWSSDVCSSDLATFMTSAIPKILAHAPWMAGVWNLGIASVTPGRKPPQPAESHQGRGQRDDCSLCRPFRTDRKSVV